jgi:hypothetical protein
MSVTVVFSLGLAVWAVAADEAPSTAAIAAKAKAGMRMIADGNRPAGRLQGAYPPTARNAKGPAEPGLS